MWPCRPAYADLNALNPYGDRKPDRIAEVRLTGTLQSSVDHRGTVAARFGASYGAYLTQPQPQVELVTTGPTSTPSACSRRPT